jgi:hypothetical protein
MTRIPDMCSAWEALRTIDRLLQDIERDWSSGVAASDGRGLIRAIQEIIKSTGGRHAVE